MMRRIPAILLALALLPGFVAAQDGSRAHTVVDGETLWGLAERYCDDPFEWPRIFEANRDRITDPHLILPGWVVSVPCGAPARVGQIQVQTPAAEEPPQEEPMDAPMVAEVSARTVFYTDPAAISSVAAVARRDYLPLSRDHMWSAEWLSVREPSGIGEVVEFVAAGTMRTALPYQHVRISLRSGSVRMGDALQVFRVAREIEGTGFVARPTGVLSITGVDGSDAEGVVLRGYDRVRLGDLVAPAPEFELSEGQVASSINSQASAEIIAFGENHVLQQIGDVALLDQGSANGVAVGDEYVLMAETSTAGQPPIAARLQVVRVFSNTSSARLVHITRPRFGPGARVRLDKKMR